MKWFGRGATKSAEYKGKLYTEYVEEVKSLKRKGKDSEATKLLLNLLPAVEYDGVAHGITAPWYYEQLAILYRKTGDYTSEVQILERYMRVQTGKPTSHAALVNRLKKARQLSAQE